MTSALAPAGVNLAQYSLMRSDRARRLAFADGAWPPRRTRPLDDRAQRAGSGKDEPRAHDRGRGSARSGGQPHARRRRDALERAAPLWERRAAADRNDARRRAGARPARRSPAPSSFSCQMRVSTRKIRSCSACPRPPLRPTAGLRGARACRPSRCRTGSPPAMATRGLFYGWAVAGATFLVMLATAGAMGAPGVIIEPLEKEFGWSTAQISVALSVRLALFGLIAPFAAAFINRFGVRRGRRVGGRDDRRRHSRLDGDDAGLATDRALGRRRRHRHRHGRAGARRDRSRRAGSSSGAASSSAC